MKNKQYNKKKTKTKTKTKKKRIIKWKKKAIRSKEKMLNFKILVKR